MSWEQIAWSAEAVLAHRVWFLGEMLDPVLTALGGKYKRGKVSRHAKKKALTKKQKAAREKALLVQLAASGIEID